MPSCRAWPKNSASRLGAASWVITCYAVAFGAAQLVFGPLGDRFDKYKVVASATLACAPTAALCRMAPGFGTLLAARLLAGATAAAIIPLSIAWIGDVIPYQQRQTVLARFLLGQIIGRSAGVALGGLAVDYFGWRMPFFGIALAFLAIGMAVQALRRRLPVQARWQRSQADPGRIWPCTRIALGARGAVRGVPGRRVRVRRDRLHRLAFAPRARRVAVHSRSGSLCSLTGFGPRLASNS
jgi:MFS family permease